MKQQKTYRKSRQRERILELLRSTHSHPTATWIYDRLKPEFPSLSMGTVYRNLSILEAQERIVRLSSGSTFDRYDASTHPHAHFRCVKCGNVYDVENTDPEEVPGMGRAEYGPSGG
ncbi:MAG: transcriptional repressor [Candidatus Marinimicrobia bacterium]|nr:transcriptional repressor [Candidatus Neomarinimicrobiota bacterium]